MTTLSIPTTTLSDGAELPLIGFGTSSMKGTGAVEGIAAALRSGYRLIDTAAQYGNEASVGEAIRASGVDSDEVLVTTKIAGGDQGREAARTGYLESLRRLGLDSAALVLIHWPNPSRGLAVDTWRTLIDLKEEGRVQHIGVSNFRPEQTEELVEATGVWPEVNQIQLSPLCSAVTRWPSTGSTGSSPRPGARSAAARASPSSSRCARSRRSTACSPPRCRCAGRSTRASS